MGKDLVRIRFEGRPLACRPGTTVAVALWENGIRVLSHSPKYGSPRGVTCARGHCTACLMRVDGVPNVRVCELAVAEGLDVRRQDTGAAYGPLMQRIMAAGGSLLPVGFYYKWCTRPPALSRLFLKAIRPLTGIGRLPEAASAARTLPPPPAGGHGETLRPQSFDVVVIGAGPSGAHAAAAAGGSVLLLDENAGPGGQRGRALQEAADYLGEDLQAFPPLRRARARLDEALRALAARPDVEFRGATRAVAGYGSDLLLLRRGADLAAVRFRRCVWAAGALDVLGLFPGNDCPGLVGPRAMYRLLTRDGLDVRGRRAVVCGAGLDLWLSAALLAARGAEVTVVADAEVAAEAGAAARARGWPLHAGLRPSSCRIAPGGGLRAEFSPADGSPAPARLRIEADWIVLCGRSKPAYDIPHQLGCELTLQPERGGFLPAAGAGGPCRVDLPGGPILEFTGEAAGAALDPPPAPPTEVRAR